MTVEKTTRLEAIQFTDDGTMLVRLQKRIVVDGEVLKEEWHRTSVSPATDPNAQMMLVNQHLAEMGFSAPPAEQLELIRQVSEVVHTDRVKTAFTEKTARQMEALAADDATKA